MHFPPPHRIPTASTQTTDWLLRNLSKTFRRSSVANATTQRSFFMAPVHTLMRMMTLCALRIVRKRNR